MVSCFKYCLIISLLAVAVSCGQDGNAPSMSCNPCKIFITATTSQGNIGASGVADQICETDANNPGDGTYKALLAYDNGSRRACTSQNCQTGGISENVDWVLRPNTTYTRVDGTVIGTTTSVAIFTFPLTNALSASAGGAWTGLDFPEWTTPANFACSNWTSTASSGPPAGGASMINDGSSYNSAFAFGRNCNANLSLICVEQ